MMDVGPEHKRPRLQSWSSETTRQLPSLPPPQPSQPNNPYPPHHSPFSRPPEPPHLIDRRPSEHPPYEHQDRRPNSGPSHTYGPPPPPPPQGYPRAPEPMVKRDPSDEPPPPQYRPPSTGNGVEHNVNPNIPPHHDSGGRPYLPPFDPTRPQYPPAPYPPTQSPMSATEPYNVPYGTTGLPPPREGNAYPSLSYPAAPPRQQPDIRKKAQRAAQACDSCRTLKAKCDEGRPSCTSCKEKGIECRYRDPPPKQQDKASADIMDTLARLEAAINDRFQRLDNRVTDIQETLIRRKPNSEAAMKVEDENVRIPLGVYGRASVGSESQRLASNESPYSATTPGLQKIPDMPEPPRPGEEASEEEEESGDPGPPKAPSIPVNHTTGAARLLLVGPIHEMLKHILKHGKIKGEKYPIVQEERRGLLRLFGRGEGYDAPPGYDRDPLTDHGDSTPGDTPSNVSSPAAGEEWGQLGGLTPPANPGNPQPEFARAGISAEGMPDFSREIVYDLVQSYNNHMNIMHPILIPSQLNALVEQFLKSIPESHAKPLQVSTLVAGHAGHPGPGFAKTPGGHRNPESPGNKRKRSPVSSDYSEIPVMVEHKPGHPFRSISSALVLLVMALGKICQYRERIPDPVSDKEHDTSFGSSPVIRNGLPPSPLQSSPSLSTPVGMPSPQDIDNKFYPRSRRTSLEGGLAAKTSSGLKKKNLDIIPGLSYFALATDVLGNQLAGNSLQHVHANILAGLYHGQLGRVMESHGYIAAACRSLQIILRPKIDRFKRLKANFQPAPGKDNPLLFAFWTCLQLESDIVAELPCPHSGILTYEEDIPNPNYEAAVQDGFDHRIIESYSAQLFLRRHLNQLHNMFYKPEGEDSQFPKVVVRLPDHFPTIEACQTNLDTIEKWAPQFMWDADRGEPARDILGARLRAKYYGAQVITYRHFILKILEISSKTEEQVTDEFKANISAPVVPSGTRIEDLDPKVLEFARNGIKALIFSTKAFHGLGDPGRVRLIVTNVWGTAHAQWGNMLTLSAAYMNPFLTNLVLEFVSREELRDLLDKTLAFLRLTATATSALAIDIKLLQHVGQRANLMTPEGPPTSSSFSSSNTGDVPMGGHYQQ
ncbi:uncharacterized protein LY89DRAFT_593488 [Mollisia scopiformis]|uniref:Zn(2)-C6 fungal-type domain-containing protein n=1 Tax=Mollisia scopiformis TaxID=149040 RepID=A0A194WWD0_MOLSC|nr:uncharacterized protein LY89DRAFT_593488 [Mollisia scopiformis]KUJ11887.1 hypothetical protein LY89DRAFT_593488 [Mollisia scopiformis]